MKGRATMRRGLTAWFSGLFFEVAGWASPPGWEAAVFSDVSGVLVLCGVITMGVVGLWNGMTPAGEAETENAAASCRRGRCGHGRPAGDAAGFITALQRAVEAGTYSVNGQRYTGLPQVVTYREEVFCEVRDGVRLFRGARVTERRMLPSGSSALSAVPRVSKDKCDGCGSPLGVAWCPPSTPYFCFRCRQREIFR